MKKKILTLLMLFALTGCASNTAVNDPSQITIDIPFEVDTSNLGISSSNSVSGSDTYQIIEQEPTYNGEIVVTLNNNIPNLNKEDGLKEFENYSELDELGRVGVAYANISTKTMPAEGEERGEIGMIKPSGWNQGKYPDVIEDLYLYNRAHMVAWCLGSENANELNLMTGTRQFNLAMVDYEVLVANYCRNTGHHVLYKATPHFTGDNLLADGLELEALSVEDDEISFHVYIFNVQDGIEIDYRDGSNKAK